MAMSMAAASKQPWAERTTRPRNYGRKNPIHKVPEPKKNTVKELSEFDLVFQKAYPQMKFILSSDVRGSPLIPQSTLDDAERIGVRLYFAGEWHLAARDLQRVFHEACPDQKPEKSVLATILAKIVGNFVHENSFANFEFLWSKYVKFTITHRPYYPCMPVPVTLPPTPPGASIDNVAKHLMSPKVPRVTVSQIAARCPGIEFCPDGITDELTKCLPDSKSRAAFLADPSKYVQEHPEFQEETHLDPDDLEKSSQFCAGCDKRISNTAYLQHIESQGQNAMICDDKGIPFESTLPRKLSMDCLYLQCPCCQKYTRLNKQIYTWFCQSLTGLSKEEQTAQKAKFNEIKETIFQATFALQFPSFWAKCPEEGCKFSSGYSVLKCHLRPQPDTFAHCAICKFFHHNPCRVGNTARCVTCARDHSIDLHVGVCPDPKCRTHVCAVCNLSGQRCHRGQPCKGNGFATLDAETQKEFLKMGIKTCPGCKTGVMQEDGCDHMSCPCGIEFCFRCQGIFTGYSSSHNCPGEGGDIERPKDPRLRGDFDHDVAARRRVEDREREIRERDRREREIRERDRRERERRERDRRERERQEQIEIERFEQIQREREEAQAAAPAPAPAPAQADAAPAEDQNAQLLQLEQAQQQMMLLHGLVANNDDIPIELLLAMFGENEQH